MGKLYAAVSVRDITPTDEIIALVNQEGRYHYEGIGHRLYLRTLVLTDREKRFVFFDTDLSSFTINEEAQELFRKELGLEPQDYMFGTNRSHNTVSGWGMDLHDTKKPGTAKYAALCLNAMFESCREAMENLVHARIGSAEGISKINCFREQYTPCGNFEGLSHSAPDAPWLRVVRVEDLDGETIALLVNYSMQNCMICRNTEMGEYPYVTSDLAGEIIDYLEKAGKHKYPVLWANGGGADRQPLLFGRLDYCDVDDDGNFFLREEVLPLEATKRLMKMLAAEQGLDVIRTVESISNYSDEFHYWSGVKVTEVPGKKPLFPKINFYKPGDDVHPVKDSPVPYRYHLAVVNDIAFTGVNCPSYSGAYKALKEMMPFPVTVFCDDNFGGIGMTCVAPPEVEEKDRYVHATLQSKAYTARIGFNAFMSGFGSLFEQYMLDTVYTYKEPGEAQGE